jgi:hypothetical protein
MLRSPTWGPSGVEIRIIDFAGQRKAVPLRIGRVVVKKGTRDEVLMSSYRTLSTVSGDPAMGR